ncbi:MAG: hypothetical protein GX080_05730 [Tissierellia bacterium]|nr:hypothetical protein [Tissierellia bacterium]
MKKVKFRKVLFIIGICVVLLGAAVIYASPGTSSDPLVSLGYLEKVAKFNVVEVKAGKILTGKGGTEIILRGSPSSSKTVGKAVIYSTDKDGLSDITAGKDLRNGANVPLNHLLIVPRDGRGVRAVTDTIYLIKGEYTIK